MKDSIVAFSIRAYLGCARGVGIPTRSILEEVSRGAIMYDCRARSDFKLHLRYESSWESHRVSVGYAETENVAVEEEIVHVRKGSPRYTTHGLTPASNCPTQQAQQ